MLGAEAEDRYVTLSLFITLSHHADMRTLYMHLHYDTSDSVALNFVVHFLSVLRLFRKAQSHPSPAVMAGITMPCLKILNFLICPTEPKSKRNQASHAHVQL